MKSLFRIDRILTVALLALPALRCTKGGYEEAPPKVSHLIAYSGGGAAALEWDAGRHRLVERAAPGTAPAYNYESNQWSGEGGPTVSLTDKVVAGRMRPDALGLGPQKKLLGMSCVGPQSVLCFAAVCTMEGEGLKGYDLRVCDDKNRTTAGCKTYQVDAGVSKRCPVYFYATAAF
jgi:hypothetical protein